MTLIDVFNSLKSNPNISERAKEEFKSILELITDKYQEIDLDYLNEKLSTIKFNIEGKYTFDGVIDYNIADNSIMFSEEKIGYYDQKNLLTNALIKLSFSNKGVPQDKYKALYEGTVCQMANMLVGNEEDMVFNQEELCFSNLVSSITNIDLEQSLINNDYSKIESEPILAKVCDKMSYNFKYRQHSDSRFIEIEKNLVDILFSGKRDNSQIDFFEINMITNENFMNEPSNYIGLNELENYYYQVKENYVNSMDMDSEFKARVR